MKLLVISSSLGSSSKSRIMAKYVQEKLQSAGHTTSYIDLRELPLPLCDGESVYENPNVVQISQQITDADGVVIAVPIYNFNVAASSKNLLEVTGYALRNKLVGVISASGGPRGYLGMMPFVNSILVDFGAWIVPRFVSGLGTSFSDNEIHDQELISRLNEFVATMLTFTRKEP